MQAPDAVLSAEDFEEEPVETYSDLDDPLVEDFEETTHNTENSFTPAQLALEWILQNNYTARAPYFGRYFHH